VQMFAKPVVFALQFIFAEHVIFIVCMGSARVHNIIL